MSQTELLMPGECYHIYNRGNNRENLFRETRNYYYFMRLYRFYIAPRVKTHAFCLLPNHFHLLLQIQPLAVLASEQHPTLEKVQRFLSLQFSNWFSTYTKAINHAYGRSGSLFMRPFKRKLVDNDRYLHHLVVYIHRNPETHGLVTDFRAWQFSSYTTLISEKRTALSRQEVLDWFGGVDAFVMAHQTPTKQTLPVEVSLDDEDGI